MNKFAVARQNMVDNQIRANKVTDPAVVEAFLSIPLLLILLKIVRTYRIVIRCIKFLVLREKIFLRRLSLDYL